MTSQRAPSPQTPIQGLTHFLWTQASILEHSSLVTHSGRHIGGVPWYSGKHEQTACSLWFRHTLLGPHGDGKHGSVLGGISKNIFKKFMKLNRIFSLRSVTLETLFTYWFWSTGCEWISYKFWRTSASRNVIDYVTISTLTTSSNARIYTFIANTCFVSWTLGTENTFWSTTFVRITGVLG